MKQTPEWFSTIYWFFAGMVQAELLNQVGTWSVLWIILMTGLYQLAKYTYNYEQPQRTLKQYEEETKK